MHLYVSYILVDCPDDVFDGMQGVLDGVEILIRSGVVDDLGRLAR